MVSPLLSVRTLGIPTTLAGVGLITQPVHDDGRGRMRLHRDGTVGHGTDNESTNNFVLGAQDHKGSTGGANHTCPHKP